VATRPALVATALGGATANSLPLKRFDTTHSRHKFESVHPSHTHTHTDSLPSISARHLLSGVCLTFTHRFTHWRYRCEKEWGWGEGTTSTRTHSEVDMVFSSHLPHTPTHTSMSSARAQSQLQADNQQQSKGDVPIVLAIPDSQGGAVEGGGPTGAPLWLGCRASCVPCVAKTGGRESE
jgi:hypothetical protein